MHGQNLDALREPADALAGESRWAGLVDLLAPVPVERLISRPGLAYRLGEAYYHTGRMEDLRELADRLQDGMRRERDTTGVMRALNLAGIAAFELGRVDAARRAFESLMELAEGEGDEDMLARAANNLGALANLQGRRAEALSLYQLALVLYQRLGQLRGLAQTHQNLAISFRDMRLLRESDFEYRQAEEIGRSFDYAPIVAMATVGRAELAALRNDPEVARKLVERGLALARELGDPITEGIALRIRALARSASPPPSADAEEPALSEARADLGAALELARRTGNLLLEAESLRDLARLERRRGRGPEADGLFRRAVDRFSVLGADGEAATLLEEADAG